MNLSFTKLKNAGLPKASAKFAKLTSAPKTKAVSIKAPKVSKGTKLAKYDFSKLTKMAKLPKSSKVTIFKKAVKKAKPFKFS